MTWSETHRRWQALQEIEALVNASSTDELPWNPTYAEIFGDPDSLIAALQYRWNLSRTTQLDIELSEEELERENDRLLERNAGVLRVLRRYTLTGPVTTLSGPPTYVEPPVDRRIPA
jgi:hypothetical protein